MADGAVAVRLADGVAALPADQWDACAGADNPFLSHAFLSALEESGSATVRTGWQPVPLLVENGGGRIAAAAPAYVKSHSQGEYVFDHNWADAWARAGGSYYPKLQVAVPFTPVPGPRLLGDPALAPALIAGIEALVRQNDLSSAHATFVSEAQLPLFEAAGWLVRVGTQFHWHNDGYATFDDFLGALASRKRKAIRKERAAAVAGGIEIRRLSGADIGDAEWDAFWTFYQDTGARKWGRPYLTRAFFTLLGQRMADRLVLVMAYRNGRPIAGALNLVGGDALYGRYWGTTEEVPFLHFELCYYQAIDEAIARGLTRVEAGAQGEHKLARGYRPVPTFSAHFIADAGFRRAVADYLARERDAMTAEIAMLDDMGPYRQA